MKKFFERRSVVTDILKDQELELASTRRIQLNKEMEGLRQQIETLTNQVENEKKMRDSYQGTIERLELELANNQIFIEKIEIDSTQTIDKLNKKIKKMKKKIKK